MENNPGTYGLSKEEIEKVDMFKAIQFETLHGCNLNCKTCPNSVIEKHNELMSEKIFFKILDDLKKVNYKGRISPYLMNEPLLDKRLDYFIKEIKFRFPTNTIYISSNGLLLDDARITELFKIGLNRLVITFYSKETSGVDGSKIYDRLKNWEIDRRVKFIKAYEQDSEISFFNRAGNIELGEEGLVMETCSKGTRQAFVNFVGQVILCCSDYWYEVVSGNVMKENLIELYNCPLLKYYRKKLRNKDRSGLKLCSKCNWHRPQQYQKNYKW